MAPLIQLSAIKTDQGVYFTPVWNLKNVILFGTILISFIGFTAAAQIQISQIPQNTQQIRQNYMMASEALIKSTGNRVILEAIIKKEFPPDQVELILSQVDAAEARASKNVNAWGMKRKGDN